MGTNDLSDLSLDADQLLARSKRRDVLQKCYALIKGPLASCPVYLHKEERIHALAVCTMVALLAFAMLELLARSAELAQCGQTRPHTLAPLAVVGLLFADGSTARRLAGLSPLLAAILQHLGLPPPTTTSRRTADHGANSRLS